MPVNQAGTSEFYASAATATGTETGNGYRGLPGATGTGGRSIRWAFSPTSTASPPTTRWRADSGALSGWNYDLGAEFGHNHFDYTIRNTLNASLGPCLDPPCAPGPDGILGTADDPGIPNQQSFFAGRLLREEFVTALNVARPVEIGLPAPVNLAFGAAFRRKRYAIREGEPASYINGFHLDQDSADVAPGGSSVFPRFTPTTPPTGTGTTSPSMPTPRPSSRRRC